MSAGPRPSSSPSSGSDYTSSKPTLALPMPAQARNSSSSCAGAGAISPYLAPDPRTSSTQSLVSSVSSSDPRRTLLLIYIHGFYGNDQSFRSFPFHVHSFLRTALDETHVIHSKIYPRYKTYRSIEIARDNFSHWLAPHESPTTDVILIGHSMGGILAADVVLMPNKTLYNQHPFKNRILGTISLDSPFLGLHPGIIVSGISSLFRDAPGQPTDQEPGDDTTQSAASSTSQLQPPPAGVLVVPPPRRQTADPGFDPPFFNDNPFKEAPFVKRIVHFAKKHRSEGIVNATAKHVLSHLEYGGCLADFHGLNVRYNRIRQLEDVDELQALSGGKPLGDKARVRFVNYYTLSSGRQKERKSPSNRTTNQSHTPATSTSAEGDSLLSRETTRDAGTSVSSFTASNVSISVEDHSSYGDKNDTPPGSKPSSLNQPANDRKPVQDVEPIHTGIDELSMQEVEPMPLPEEDVPAADQALDLPPIPELPDRPPTPDFEQYTDKDSRKQAEKEFRRVKKSCDKAIKDRNKAVREREKLLEKRRRKAQKDAEKVEKEEAAQLEREEANDSKPPQDGEENTASLEKEEPTTEPALREPYTVEEKRPKKSKKFCTLPRKVNGARDSTWVDIYMDGMDEVSAHCGLFFPGPHYERLVGDVTSRIIGWVQDDLTKRTILEMEKD